MAIHRLELPDFAPPAEKVDKRIATAVALRSRESMPSAFRLLPNDKLKRLRRRVSLVIEAECDMPAEDLVWENMLFNLKMHGLLVGVDLEWCERGDVEWKRAERRHTTVILEDIEDE